MIRVKGRIQFNGAFATGDTKALKAGVRDSLHDIGGVWHGGYLKMHFMSSAYWRYPGTFKKRSKSYVKRKRNDLPMVYRGTARSHALSIGIIDASDKRVRVTFAAPRVINLSNRKNYPDLRAELTAINSEEIQRFANRLQNTLVKNVEQYPSHKE